MSYSLGKTLARVVNLDKAKLSSKGQLIIPKKYRQQLNLKPGDEFNVLIKDGYLVLSPAEKSLVGWQKWRGTLAGYRVLQEHLDEHFREVD